MYSIVNSWLLFRKAHDNTIKQATFRAEGLCKVSEKTCFKKGRSSNDIEQQYQLKKGDVTNLPVKNNRLDSVEHWPEWMASRQLCKSLQCKFLRLTHCFKCVIGWSEKKI